MFESDVVIVYKKMGGKNKINARERRLNFRSSFSFLFKKKTEKKSKFKKFSSLNSKW